MAMLQNVFEKIASLKVGVLGDVMLDTYMWGKVERISPEAPVPVVSLHHKEYRLGGAGNVALNCHSLGVETYVLSVTGNDADAEVLKGLFQQKQIQTLLIQSDGRKTTNKIRVIGRNQQMLRIDDEVTDVLTPDEEREFLYSVRHFITTVHPDVLIFQDYNKGVLTENVITEIITLCREKNILTAVDPKRKNFFSYRFADIFKPNLKEVKEALNIMDEEVSCELLETIHKKLHSLLQHKISLITLSEKGVYYHDGKQSAWIPSHLRNISDVSGAGDTVIAVASLVYAATQNIHLMAEMANIAGGLVCEEVGTVSVSKEKLMHESELLLA
ncbi:MAG: bifunctional ADP-heptose synthase [Chitinophagaceae bacterium]|nr:bifunctional ADP-heptose synthase [Chitinophagaceae bacterium]